MLHASAQDSCAERGRRHIAMTLADKILSQDLEVLYAGELFIEESICSKHVDGLRQALQLKTLLRRNCLATFHLIGNLFPELPKRSNQSSEQVHLIIVALFAVIQEP